MFLSPSIPKKAVAYYRHSAEDKQENSVPIQREHASKFANEDQIDIIHEEADEGKSGLSANRPGFGKLFDQWILNDEAPPFDYVLVYDVSRWGRFQDNDEAAYYEFRCKQRGKKVIYVSRGFPKEEQQLISHLQTSIERYMAAEYSRQLSEKVFYGCVKVSEQGYSAGGLPAYGMTRVLLDANKKLVKTLNRGEWKSISNERVSFAPKNDHTTETVRDIFTLLVARWNTPKEIAEHLNIENVPSANGGIWDTEKVIRILTNETYIGTRVYNKTWSRLKQKMRRNPRSEWVIHPNAFPWIVSHELFGAAQEHLYWLMFSRWKRGIYTIRRIERIIQAEIDSLRTRNGIILQKHLPITYAITFSIGTEAHWCFKISEIDRNLDFVIAVAIQLESQKIDRFFWIPTKDFNTSNFIVFSEKDPRYPGYFLDRQKLEEKILDFYREQKQSS